jgi:hypothetical protein
MPFGTHTLVGATHSGLETWFGHHHWLGTLGTPWDSVIEHLGWRPGLETLPMAGNLGDTFFGHFDHTKPVDVLPEMLCCPNF